MKTENDHINLKVAGQDGSVVQFKIKRHTPLSKLMKAYCERQVSFFAVPEINSGIDQSALAKRFCLLIFAIGCTQLPVCTSVFPGSVDSSDTVQV